MTKAELIAAIEASADERVFIESGKPGYDYDTGYAYVHEGNIRARWDSGFYNESFEPVATTNIIERAQLRSAGS